MTHGVKLSPLTKIYYEANNDPYQSITIWNNQVKGKGKKISEFEFATLAVKAVPFGIAILPKSEA